MQALFTSLCRYSGDFTDSFGHLQTTKLGINNNGYIPYVDYNRDYTPPPSLTLNHVKPTYTSSSLSNHLIIGTSTTTPTITSASIVGISTGTITNGTYSLTRNRPLDRLLENGLPSGTNTLPHNNGLISSELHIQDLNPQIVQFFFSFKFRSIIIKYRSEILGGILQSILKATTFSTHHGSE